MVLVVFSLHEGMREEKVRCVGDGASGGENRGGGGVGRGRSGPEPGGRGGGGRLAAVQGFEEAPEKDNAISLTELCQVVMLFFLTTSMVLAGFLSVFGFQDP
jgi:hypothetical protein